MEVSKWTSVHLRGGNARESKGMACLVASPIDGNRTMVDKTEPEEIFPLGEVLPLPKNEETEKKYTTCVPE